MKPLSIVNFLNGYLIEGSKKSKKKPEKSAESSKEKKEEEKCKQSIIKDPC